MSSREDELKEKTSNVKGWRTIRDDIKRQKEGRRGEGGKRGERLIRKCSGGVKDIEM